MQTNFLIHRQTYFRQYMRSKKKSYGRILVAMLWDKTFQFNDNGFKALFGILVAKTSIGCAVHTTSTFMELNKISKIMDMKLRIYRGRQIVIEAPHLTYFHGFWQRGPC